MTPFRICRCMLYICNSGHCSMLTMIFSNKNLKSKILCQYLILWGGGIKYYQWPIKHNLGQEDRQDRQGLISGSRITVSWTTKTQNPPKSGIWTEGKRVVQGFTWCSYPANSVILPFDTAPWLFRKGSTVQRIHHILHQGKALDEHTLKQGKHKNPQYPE